MYHTLEAQKVLDDDSSKILLFFTSSTFNLSRQKPTLYQTLKVDELQPLQKGVVISWLGPLKHPLTTNAKPNEFIITCGLIFAPSFTTRLSFWKTVNTPIKGFFGPLFAISLQNLQKISLSNNRLFIELF